MQATKIEWADATFNPWWGCERVSPACAHCYADTFARRLGMGDLWPRLVSKEGSSDISEHGFRFFGVAHWDEPLKWARTLPEKLGRRPRVFCASMADVFEERPELEEHRRRLHDLIEATPELDWLVLTKRPEFARDWLESVGWMIAYLPNVWLGVSIENARFTWRADVLREIPVAVRFISAEPLLGSLYEYGDTQAQRAAIYERYGSAVGIRRDLNVNVGRAPLNLDGIDWVIIGGESGPKARPFHLEHAREIIRACDPYQPVCCGNQDNGECCGDPEPRGAREQLPAVFVKQLGAKPIETHPYIAGVADSFSALKLRDKKGGDPDEWPVDLRIREFPQTAVLA